MSVERRPCLSSTVTFGNVITAHRTVTLDNGNKTVGTVVFNAAPGYTLNGANTLILDTAGGDSAITVTDGSHSIDAAVQLNKNVGVFVTAGNSLNISGQVSGGACPESATHVDVALFSSARRDRSTVQARAVFPSPSHGDPWPARCSAIRRQRS